jgi:hypothetical protein
MTHRFFRACVHLGEVVKLESQARVERASHRHKGLDRDVLVTVENASDHRAVDGHFACEVGSTHLPLFHACGERLCEPQQEALRFEAWLADFGLCSPLQPCLILHT